MPVLTEIPVRATTDAFPRLSDARDLWLELSERAAISPYQTYSFASAWFETIGRAEGVRPFIIVERDHLGRPRALLPLCVQTRAGCDIAQFLGGRESNFNLPLLAPGARYDGAGLRALLLKAARAAQSVPDLIYLRNQPRRFDAFDNPLAFPDARPSASFAYGTTLPARVEELAARLSKDARKKLKKKEARLAEMGALSYEHGVAGTRALDVIETLIRQKTARFSDMGVVDSFERRRVRAFLDRLLDQKGDGALELHALSVGGRIAATYAGIVRGGRFSGMLNSFEMDEELARSSPGDLLLHALMRNLVSRGMTHFDLGAGEARYKNAVCDETIELCDVIMPVSTRGMALAPAFSAYLQLKRRVKQNPALSGAYFRAKRLATRAG
ncbi:GNAT family N-acetyltransferase [Methylocystis parvus]|uniref:GNAT family N-acetyltransferase n=1 Tax=Methylocystis parvus TaxID=134 RepID=A0A6B8MF04_9HYPH|nr:GNAT family N-acetyltransferase [Methylocystis parvus]QGM99250.1 GNAT family N-acetyltransferase [Methylocystis parvus]WBK00369.1 GNAT family N-acetyltransferase [Methylocystis parvus OBBP]